MANSSIIGNIKNKIIKEMIKDPEIIKAFNSNIVPETSPESYINKHIFNYNQNPNTLNDVMTFVTIQVHIPRTFEQQSYVFIKPEIEFYIVSHERNLIVDNVPKVKQNRNDYLSNLIDLKFNGRSGFGIGKLTLKSNTEGTIQQSYLYRRMIFEITDLNDSLCNPDDE